MGDVLEKVRVKTPPKNKDRRGWRFYVHSWDGCIPGETVGERLGRDGSVVGSIECEQVEGPDYIDGRHILFQLGKYAHGQRVITKVKIYPATPDGFFFARQSCVEAVDAVLGDE